MDHKILIALQFWNGDRSRALELARLLADIEPKHTSLADVLLACRFDSSLDKATSDYLSRKFNVYTFRSRRRGVGWPDGCNDLWFSVMEWTESMIKAKKVPSYKAILTVEPDGGPTNKNWIGNLSAAWDNVRKKQKVVVGGALVAGPAIHINGNALFTGDPGFLYLIARRITGIPSGAGWDYALRHEFERLGWADMPQIKSFYRTPTCTSGQFDALAESGVQWLHGVRDDSLIKLGRKKLVTPTLGK